MRPVAGRRPAIASASSVRPAPTSPAMPSTSPRARVRLTSWTMPGTDRSWTDSRLSVRRGILGREDVLQLAAHHRGRHVVFRHLAAQGAAHDRAVAQHGDAVGQTRDLVQPVRAEHQRHTFGAQPVDLRVKRLDLAVGQRGRGFVHDQHTRLARQRLGDFHHLPVGNRQVADAGIGADGRIQPRQQIARGAAHGRVVKLQTAGQFASKEDVAGDRQVRGKVEFLMDHHDPGSFGIGTAAERDRAPVQQHLPAGGRQIAAKDLHDRGLARAVFADQRVDLARAQRQVDAVQNLDRAEAACHRPKRKHGRHSRTSVQAPSRADDDCAAAMNASPDSPSASPGNRARGLAVAPDHGGDVGIKIGEAFQIALGMSRRGPERRRAVLRPRQHLRGLVLGGKDQPLGILKPPVQRALGCRTGAATGRFRSRRRPGLPTARRAPPDV